MWGGWWLIHWKRPLLGEKDNFLPALSVSPCPLPGSWDWGWFHRLRLECCDVVLDQSGELEQRE